MKVIMNTIRKSKKYKGQVLVYVAVILIIIFALAALAIDVGISYNIKAKLNCAVDGAALAAGNGVKQGSDDNARKNNARDAAERFLNANYPAGYMGSTLLFNKNDTVNFNPVHNKDGSWTIAVMARALTPTFFARAVGWSSMNVKAQAETTVRDLDMILVLDTSGSLGPPTSPSNTFPTLQQAAINFINRFSDANGGDRIGLVSFASGAVLDVPINKDNARGFNKNDIVKAINNLTVGGSTASEEAMRRALVELNAIDPSIRSSLRVIVFFSDGAPNDVAGTFSDIGQTGTLYSETDEDQPPNACTKKAHRLFPVNQRNGNGNSHDCNINTLPEQDYTSSVNLEGYNGKRALKRLGVGNNSIVNTRCNVNKAARNMVENLANTARGGTGNNAVTVYTIGLGERLNSLEIHFCEYGAEEYGANILKRLANASDSDTRNANQPTGLYVFAQDSTRLDAAFQTIANQILRISK